MILVPRTRRRRMSLTPMIDVVFLLLVFFMLAARFGSEGTLTLATEAGGAAYEGPPRLLDVYPSTLRLNGAVIGEDEATDALSKLMVAPDDIIVIRSRESADVQRLIDVMERLGQGGFGTLVLAE
jgi:biopolymer transport protein ExbD